MFKFFIFFSYPCSYYKLKKNPTKEVFVHGRINWRWGGLKTGWSVKLKGLWSTRRAAGDHRAPRGWYQGQYCFTSSVMSWMIGQTAPSSRLQMIPDGWWMIPEQGLCLIHLKFLLLFNRIWTSRRIGQNNFEKFNKEIWTVLQLRRNNPTSI